MIKYNTILHDTRRHDMMQCDTIIYKTVQQDTNITIRYNKIQNDTITHKALRYNTKHYTTIQYNDVQDNATGFKKNRSLTINDI